MAGTLDLRPSDIPSQRELVAACNLYNNLPEDHEQPHPSNDHLAAVANIIIDYNAQDTFGIHLIHGHLRVPGGHVMLGIKLQARRGVWTKPIPIEGIPGDVHGYIYAFTPAHRFEPYEFRAGPCPRSLVPIDPNFFHAFANYILQNNLATILGLEVLDNNPVDMKEFVIDEHGTVMLQYDDTWSPGTSRYTGWTAAEDEKGVRSFKGSSAHYKPPDVPHITYTDGKLLTDEDQLLKFMADKKLIQH